MSAFEVIIDWPASAGALDSSTYLLAGDGKVRSDADMIFYNQPSDPAGSVRITRSEAGQAHFAIDLGAVPAAIERIVMCVTIEEPGRSMVAFQGLRALIRANGETQVSFAPELADAREVALRVIELYRRNGAWRIRADGQGFNDGLAPLARSFGIDVAEDNGGGAVETPRPAPVASAAATVPARQADTPAPRSPSPPAREDGTVRLGPDRTSHRWSVGDTGGLGQISVRLSWSGQCGGLGGRPRKLELALGCLYELQNGERGAVQSWDGSGALDAAPFVQLSSAESTDASQRLRVNGEQWQKLRRLALYAFIPEGASSWRGASVTVEVSAGGREAIHLSLEGGIDGCGIVGLLLLENTGNEAVFTRLARFMAGHQELDQALDWGLRWRVRGA
jgi:tellurite resistance protein TerA